MERIKHKAFLEAMLLVNSESKKAKLFLNDKRMTFQEKTILSSFLALRDFENQDVIDVLIKMTCHDPFVDSQRHYCLGAAYNNLTQFKEAEFHLLESIRINSFKGAEVFRFGACQSLFTVYLNLHHQSGMQEMIHQMKTLIHIPKFGLLYIKSCEFALAIQRQEFEQAKKILPFMEKNYSTLNEHQRISYFYDLFDFHLFLDDYTGASEALDRIKRYKKYKNASHTKYMQSIIDYLDDGSTIYLYEKDFQGFPFLLQQLIVLKSLQIGDRVSAKLAWERLRHENSISYAADFHYKGPPDLFGKALAKLTGAKVTPIIEDFGATKESKLYSLLKNAQGPIPKEALYQAIWDTEFQSKDDLMKLAKLLQRTKEKYSIEVKSIKGAYSLVSKKAS